MKKSEIIQQVLDRTVKDITLLKEEVIGKDRWLQEFYLDNSVNGYLIHLRELLVTYKEQEGDVL